MALTRQDIEVPLNAGVDTKASDSFQTNTTASVVNNLRLDKTGEYIKTSTTASTTTGSNNITSIFTKGEDVCAITKTAGILTLDPTDPTAFIGTHRSTPITYTNDTIPKYAPRDCQVYRDVLETIQDTSTNVGMLAPASELSGDYLISAWFTIAVDLTKQLNFKVTHTPTNQTIYTTQYKTYINTQITIQSLPTATGCTFFILSGTGAPFTITPFDYNITTHVVTQGSPLTSNAKYKYFAVSHMYPVATDGYYYLAFTDNTTGFIKAQLRTHTTVATTHNSTVAGQYGLALYAGVTRTLIAFASATTLYCECYGVPTATVIMTRNGTSTFEGVEIGALSTTSALVYVNEGQSTGVGKYNTTRFGVVSFLSSSTPTIDWYFGIIPSSQIAIKPFVYDSQVYIGVSPKLSASSSTNVVNVPAYVMLMRYTPYTSNGTTLLLHEPVARLMHDRFYSPVSKASVSSTKAHFVFTGDIQNRQYAATLFHSVVDFTTKPIPYAEVNNSTYLAGGLLLHWDGETPSEATPLAPPIVEIDTSTVDSYSLDPGFSAIAIYTWVDKNGDLHRSAPSSPVASGVFVNKLINVFVSKPIFSGYGERGPKIECQLYVTENNGATYYRAPFAGGTLAYPTDYSDSLWKFTEIEAAGIYTNNFPLLYSTGVGGTEIVSEAPPAFDYITKVADRLWGIMSEDPRTLWYTKPFVSGYAPEWSSLQTILLGEKAVSIIELQSIPVVLGSKNIWAIEGSGPDSLGAGQFGLPRKLHTISCIDPNIASTPLGVIFRTLTGFYLLTSGMGLEYLGAPIETDTKISDSTLLNYIPGKIIFDELSQEVRFIDSDRSRHWVYKITEGKFSTKTLTVIDGVTTSKGIYWLTSSDTITREYRLGETNHNLSTDSWTYTTPWLSLSGLAGFNRIWEVIIQVKLPSSGMANSSTLTATISARSTTTSTDTFTWTGAQLQTLGSAGDVVDLRIKPSHQRLKALKLQLEESCSSAYNSVIPVNIRIVYGADKSVKNTKTNSLKGAV